MFKLSEIKELIKLVDSTSVHELEIENEGSRLLIRKPGKPEIAQAAQVPAAHTYIPVAAEQHALSYVQPAQQASSAPASATAAAAPAQDKEAGGAQAASGLHQIVSPMVGTFYRAPSPGAEPFVKVGDRVNEKTVVCILEAMKLMNPIEAEVSGEIVEILVENGELVEYGQPLFLVKTL
jgi:acetyl-CoA carboxylase biotin carboxyl carrier protein